MKTTTRWRVAQHFEIKWWKNYLKNKKIGDYLSWKKNYWENFFEKLKSNIKIDPESKVLDAGCGPAGIFTILQHSQITAIDPLLDSYDTNLQHFKKEQYPNTKFQNVALENYSAEDVFDVVFCINAINHVSDLEKSFENLVKSAKAKGKLVVSIDAHNHQLLKHIFRWQPADILHPHQYDLQEYEKMLTDLGCKILQIELVKKEFLFNHYVLVAEKQ